MARQFGGLTAARAGAAALSFLWLATATRFLPVSEFADLALVLTVVVIMSVFADCGLAIVLNEALAAEPERGRATLLLVIRRRMMLSVGAAAVMGVLYLAGASDPNPAVPALFAVSMLASALHTSCSAALRGAVSVVPEAVNEVASRAFVLVVGLAALANGAGLLGAVAAYVAADLVSALALTFVAWRSLPSGMPADRSRFQARRLVPLGLAAIAAVIYYRIDVWLLALVSVAAEVAQYTVCYRIIDVLILPAGALAVVTIGSNAMLDDRAALARTDRMARLLCLCVLPAVIVLEVIPGPLLRLAFGSSYELGAPVMRILALAVVPSVAALVWAPLVALRQRGILVVTAGSLVANVALNIVLIPAFGAEGAAAATVVGQIAFAVALRLRLAGLGTDDGAPMQLNSDLTGRATIPARPSR